jgi:hypothetical protein
MAYCIKCKQKGHGKISCAKKENQNINAAIGSGMKNIHRCPKCASTFEKIDGCADMDCLVCKHRWCWTCGSNLNSKYHEDPWNAPC